jgi:predicted dehydrogenase
MTAGHPWPAELRRLTGHGPLRRAHTRIRFPVDLGGGGYRLRPELGGGAFLDAAPYWLQAVQDLAGLDGATVRGRSRFDGPGGADTEFTARLELPGGIVATLDCGFGPYAADHTFSFEGAEVRLRNFLRPAAAPFPVNLVIHPVDGSKRVHSFPAVAYYDAQLARIVAVLNGEAAHTDTPRRQAARVAVLEDAYAGAVGQPC